jgi:hypothetical protein
MVPGKGTLVSVRETFLRRSEATGAYETVLPGGTRAASARRTVLSGDGECTMINRNTMTIRPDGQLG